MTDPRLRERLLDLEPETPNLRAKYDEEIKNMYDHTLTPMQRYSYIGCMIVGALLFLGFGIAFFELAPHYPFPFRAMLLVSALLGAVSSIGSGRILYRGKLDRRLDWNIELVVVWTGVTLIFLISLWIFAKTGPQIGVSVLIGSLFPFLIAMLATIQRWIQRSQMKTEETLLRMQLQIAELNENLGGAPPNTDENDHSETNG